MPTSISSPPNTGSRCIEFRNEANAWGSYAQWESHWLVCADAMRKAMADVNLNYGKSLALQICGPTMPGPYWDYSLPDPTVDIHGWGSVAWKKIHTDIYGNEDPSIWNFGMYDYHRYRTDGAVNEAEIATLRQNIATASNAPNATIPLLITEYNTSTGGNFTVQESGHRRPRLWDCHGANPPSHRHARAGRPRR